jgi:cytosine/adenosine deaminase-related metal-dependent hydrolase
MIAYRADWVCPIDRPPIRDGVVAVDNDGRIAAVGPRAGYPDRWRDLGRVALLPGLVNAHTHVELSWLRDRVPPASAFTSWVKQLFLLRRRVEEIGDPHITGPAEVALREARACGTAAIGDISNSLASVDPIAQSGLHALVFHELLGFAERDGRLVEQSVDRRRAAQSRSPRVRVSMAPHAPYSTSAELFTAIRLAVDGHEPPITSVHVGESPEELELLDRGTGEWAALLKLARVWRDDWSAPRCGPVEYLDRLGVIDSRTLVVHGVQLTDRSLAVLAQLGATLVTCPRSNQWVGVGVPPIDRFYRAGVAVAVGTDSLASVSDLNLFSELKAMRWIAPDVPARRLLESATLIGARALGLESELGTLTAGKRADVIAVDFPSTADDVEEYLVSGIEPGQIRWIARSNADL